MLNFLICLLAYPNVRTEPQSEIGRNRGKKVMLLQVPVSPGDLPVGAETSAVVHLRDGETDKLKSISAYLPSWNTRISQMKRSSRVRTLMSLNPKLCLPFSLWNLLFLTMSCCGWT